MQVTYTWIGHLLAFQMGYGQITVFWPKMLIMACIFYEEFYTGNVTANVGTGKSWVCVVWRYRTECYLILLLCNLSFQYDLFYYITIFNENVKYLYTGNRFVEM